MVNVVEIVVEAVNKTKEGLGAAEKDAGGFSSKMQSVGLIGAAALGGVAVASLDMAAKFDSSMTMLQTQAGVSKQTMQQLSAGVLGLAGQVGFSPDSLAEAAYHVASNMSSMGATSTQMLNAVKVAAEGAATGHADLVDVTNALGAAIASGMKGTQDYSKAMGILNATVGAGDMHMQDLANAFGSGLLATVKGFGISITDVGAALAVFGDNNIRGAQAGTQLRMAVQAMASPSVKGADALAKIGMSATQLATDMQHGGLNQAMTDLRNHMIAAGDAGNKTGAVLTDAFGKKAGAGINILYDQYGRLQSKYTALNKGANDFGAAVATNNQTLSQRMKDVEGQFEALAIEIGNKLMPVVQGLFGFLAGHSQVVTDIVLAVLALTGALAGYALVTKTVAIAQEILNAVLDMNPFVAIGIAVVAIAAVIIKYHTQIWNFIVKTWDQVLNFLKQWWPLLLGVFTGGFGLLIGVIIKYHSQIWNFIVKAWTDISDFFVSIWNAIYNNTIGAVVRLFGGIESIVSTGFDSWWKSHGLELEEVWNAVWGTISAIFKAVWGVIESIAATEWDAFTARAKVVWSALQVAWSAVWSTVSAIFRAYWAVITAQAEIAWAVISTYFKVVWAVIQGVFKVALAVVEAAAKNTWDAIAAAVKIAWALIEAVLKIAWDIIVGAFSVFLDLVTGHWSKAWTDVKLTAVQVWNAIKGFLSSTWNAIAGLAGQVFNNMKNMMAGVWNSIKATASSVWGALKSGFSATVSAIGTAWGKLEGVFKTPVNFLINTVYDNGIRRFWDDVVNAVGLNALDLPAISGLSTGGKLGGYGGGDSVLAMLEPGEAVVDKDRTKKYAPLLRAMGVPGFSAGGVIGGWLGDVGGFFSSAWDKVANGGKMAAAIASGNQTAFANAFNGMIPGGVGGATGDLASVMATMPAALVKHVISGAWDKLTGAGKAASSPVGNVGSGVARWKSLVDRALSMEGMPLGLDSRVLAQMVTESGGNPNAINLTDSNAAMGDPSRGLLQVIGSTFSMYHWPGTSNNIYDPLANIAAAINYARAVYGPTLADSYGGMGSGHGYAAGGATSPGWAMVGERGRELMKLPGGAHVYPAGQTAQMVAGGVAPGGLHITLELGPSFKAAGLSDAQLNDIRATVRAQGGGDVQKAFGKH